MPADLAAVFLDRDGVINRKAEEGQYITSWQDFEFIPNALVGIRTLATAGIPIVVVTNQRGIALGRMSDEDVEDIHRRMSAAIAAAGGRIDAIYYCPHDVGCGCRKPEIEMFRRAADDLGIALERSAVVGDSPSDVLAATRIGALRVMVCAAPDPTVDYAAADLADAARWLVGSQASQVGSLRAPYSALEWMTST